LRMVPESLARPFILGTIQPRLTDRRRANYLSLQSFCGRLVFALPLIAFSLEAPEAAGLGYAEIRHILACYGAAGLAVLAALAATLRRAGLKGGRSYAAAPPPK